MTELTKQKLDWKEAFDFAGLSSDTPSESRGTLELFYMFFCGCVN